MLMIATVREVRFNSLLVRDRATSQNVIVNTRNTRGFSREILSVFCITE